MNTTALQELRELRAQEKDIKARIEIIKDQAVTEARAFTQGGKFELLGHSYILERDESYDFVGKPQKYTMPEGVAFRQKTAEQKELKAKSSVITKALKAIRDAFPVSHPNIEPDEITYTVKCLD